MSHRILTLSATHLRPPATITASASREVTLDRADYTTVASAVPFWKSPRSGALRPGDYGDSAPADFSGFTDRAVDVRVRDVFIVGSEAFEVRLLGNVGPHVRVFDLARVVLP